MTGKTRQYPVSLTVSYRATRTPVIKEAFIIREEFGMSGEEFFPPVGMISEKTDIYFPFIE
ncbi:hypothetical protein AOE01nite_12920 [Acetobacter oeni]|uniref:Uncharacterized protein n=1 Tax=Acetobacter oeni TaxID=304077 RepID=A0A511XJF9_9PROT|nr:hypothetical protein AA21952_1553 [Acetobacter oeni LMG 21952]GEN63068.1 hypothetical protein AOE01nite_12920 [Acetobacter oeni]